MATELKSNIPHLVAGMKRRAALAARSTASSINADIRVSMGGSKHGKEYTSAGKRHVASAPGEAPAIDKGEYVQTFHSEKVDDTTFAVGTTDPRGPALELGGAHVAARPHMGPAFERAKEGFGENLKEIFEG
jgi:hypothetical protein